MSANVRASVIAETFFAILTPEERESLGLNDDLPTLRVNVIFEPDQAPMIDVITPEIEYKNLATLATALDDLRFSDKGEAKITLVYGREAVLELSGDVSKETIESVFGCLRPYLINIHADLERVFFECDPVIDFRQKVMRSMYDQMWKSVGAHGQVLEEIMWLVIPEEEIETLQDVDDGPLRCGFSIPSVGGPFASAFSRAFALAVGRILEEEREKMIGLVYGRLQDLVQALPPRSDDAATFPPTDRVGEGEAAATSEGYSIPGGSLDHEPKPRDPPLDGSWTQVADNVFTAPPLPAKATDAVAEGRVRSVLDGPGGPVVVEHEADADPEERQMWQRVGGPEEPPRASPEVAKHVAEILADADPDGKKLDY